jgi:hypothetical protein
LVCVGLIIEQRVIVVFAEARLTAARNKLLTLALNQQINDLLATARFSSSTDKVDVKDAAGSNVVGNFDEYTTDVLGGTMVAPL